MDTDTRSILALHRKCAKDYTEFKRKYGNIKFNFVQKLWFDKSRFESLKR